jgi:hypothetical protein
MMNFLPMHIIFTLALALSSPLWADTKETKSITSQGLFNIGGAFSFPIEHTRHGDLNLGINVSPQFGWFFASNWELRTSVNLKASYELRKSHIINAPFFWDVSAVPIYFFRNHSNIRPYIGLGLGMGFMNWNIYSLNVIIDVPLGFLVVLSDNIALDLGIPTRIRGSMRSSLDRVEITPGLIGIRYYF